MKTFSGKLAVITGAGSGIGRELARLLAAAGCAVAICDVSQANAWQTLQTIAEDLPEERPLVTTHVADVSDEQQMLRCRDEIVAQHGRDHIHLLFNNAGIAGLGGSMIADSRADWDRTFDICWRGVYLGVRIFLPLLQRAPEAHIANTSSVAGFWASVGPKMTTTSYAAAKFAVRGFTEALITDMRINAPHIGVSLIMPGHVGTSILANTRNVVSGANDGPPSPEVLVSMRKRLGRAGMSIDAMSDDDIVAAAGENDRRYIANAPLSPREAAEIILEGISAGKWRIFVGKDAVIMDSMVRAEPDDAYEGEFFGRVAQAVGWHLN